jgi:hypothetical protein
MRHLHPWVNQSIIGVFDEEHKSWNIFLSKLFSKYLRVLLL